MKLTLLVLVLFVGMGFGQFPESPLRDLLGDIEAGRPVRPLCAVGLNRSPLIRGKFRLGMSRASFDAASGPVLIDVGRITSKDVALDPTFFEDRLIRLGVTYRSGVEWDADAEFAYVIAEEFKLPPAAWRSNGQLGLVMFCDGWLILAESNRLEIRDERAIAAKSKADAAARIAEAEAKKKTFKP